MVTSRLRDTAVKLIKGMIKIPALSGQESAKCDYIYNFLIQNKIQASRIKNNLILPPPFFDSNKKTLLLCSHIDTVDPASTYTVDPYGATETEDKIIGLGSNDDGASVVSQISTFLHFCDPKTAAALNVNLMVILSAEEEKSGKNGMALALRSLREDKKLPYPDFAIVGEPTGMRPAVAEKGLIVLDGVCLGKSGHVANGEGENALYKALDDIAAIRSVKFKRKSEFFDGVRVSVTQINAGAAHNVVPDRCAFVVDIRPTDRYTNEEIVAMLQKRCKGKLTPRNMEHRVRTTPAGHPLRKCIEGLGLQSFISPATSDWTRLDIPAIKMGPGDSARSHKADEFILKSEIADGIDKYITFCRRL